MDEYRVLVCGGRNYLAYSVVFQALEVAWKNCSGFLTVIEGGARGADAAACMWSEEHEAFGVRHLQFPADWKTHGRSAGPIRNKQMLDESHPDLCMWFPGGNGTRSMISLARVAGVPVVSGELLDEVREAVRALPRIGTE